MSICTITLLGNLTKDAELRENDYGKFLNFSIANNMGFGDNKTTTFFNCNYFSKGAENFKQYLTKGTSLMITGEFTTNEYRAKDSGELRIGLNVKVQGIGFGSKKENNDNFDEVPAKDISDEQPAQEGDLDDEIPF